MQCFLVCPIGEVGSPIRKRSDGFLREVIKPVAEARGYDVERADHDKAPGVVTEAIVEKLVSADLVIADLHDHNPNVMYEVAIRHATGRPIVQMIPIGEGLRFDIGGLNTIFYDPSVDGLDRWRLDLGEAMNAVIAGEGGENPVSRASLFRALRESTMDRDQLLGSLARSVEALRLELRGQSRTLPPSSHSSRVLLPPGKYVEARISQFLEQVPYLSDLMFMMDTHDKTLQLTVFGKELDGPARATFEYEFDWDDKGRIQIQDLGMKILSDLAEIQGLTEPSSEKGDRAPESVG